MDAEGQLVSPANGFIVQGRMYDNGQLQDGIRDIKLPFGQKVSANPTTQAVLAGKRELNLRQVKLLAARFRVPMEALAG